MTRERLFEEIKRKQSYLCVGLDTDISKIPTHLLQYPDPVFEFNKQIIDATQQYCVAYKPNTAFYEVQGSKGWESLEKTLNYIPEHIFTIADAKRGDIGNTSKLYARTFFETLDFDAVTVAPYMGEDSITPFLDFDDKWVILLAHTSNKGSMDFQQLTSDQKPLYQRIIEKSSAWGSVNQLMYVVGATHPEKMAAIRQMAPDHFFLVPGVGAQGGDLEAISKNGMNAWCGLLVNASRSIIFAGSGKDFARKAADEAKVLQQQMGKYLQAYL